MAAPSTSPKGLHIPLKPAHLKRYKDLVKLVLKYSSAPTVRTVGVGPAPRPEGEVEQDAEKARSLAEDLEGMGPTFVKLGQLLSTRPDILPPPYLEALARLQEDVEPFPYEDVERVVQEELEVRISKAFETFDPRPLAAASLGQVHRATLRGGREVAVKVQRPGVQEAVRLDMEVFADVAKLADDFTEAGRKYAFSALLEDFRKALTAEMDYRQEAENLAAFGKVLEGFERIVVPSPVSDYTTTRVLTMEFVRGRSVGSMSRLALRESDGEVLLDELFRAYVQTALVHGLLHADPHPGNVFLTDDGGLAILDLGMVMHLSEGLKRNLIPLVIGVGEGEEKAVVDRAEALGRPLSSYDRKGFERDVGELLGLARDTHLRKVQLGRLMMGVASMAGERGLRPPPELALVGKTLLNLDGIAAALAPDFDPNEAVRKHTMALTQHRLLGAATPGSAASALLDAKDFMQELPGRLGRVLDAVARSDLEVRVRVLEDAQILTALHQLANRVTTGLVLAAVIVGAALMMNIETRFTLLGYPVLALLFFFAAASGCVALLYSIWHGDRVTQQKAKEK